MPNSTMRARRQSLLSVLAVALVGIARPLTAQRALEPVAIPATCSPCASRAILEYTISGRVADIEGRPRGAVQDAHGRLLLWYTRDPIFVFDSVGRVAARVGKVGNGPGEITPVRWVVAGPDDTVRVLSTGRINVFAGRAFRYVRSAVERSPDAAPWQVVFLPSGVSARLSNIVADGTDRNPIYLRDRSGRLIRELSPTTWEYRPTRALAAASSKWRGQIWMAESRFVGSDGYTVQLLDTVGKIQQSFIRRPPWWVSLQAVRTARMLSSMSDTVSKPAAQIVSLREDSRGRLQILASIPQPDWAGIKAEDLYQSGNLHSVLEVTDLRVGRLIAMVRVEGSPVAVIGDDRFVTYREDRDGYPYVDVWRIAVPN